MKTSWKVVRVCGRCLSENIKWEVDYCGDCGKVGVQYVLKRYVVSLFKIAREYKKYSNYVNPFEKGYLNKEHLNYIVDCNISSWRINNNHAID